MSLIQPKGNQPKPKGKKPWRKPSVCSLEVSIATQEGTTDNSPVHEDQFSDTGNRGVYHPSPMTI